MVAVLILAGAPLFAANYTANTSGDFNTATNYSPTATLPFTAADHITVDPSVTLTVSSDTTVGSITFSNGGGQLISLSPATTLNVSNVNGNGHGIEFGNPTLTNALISVGSGTLNVLDDIKIVGGISFSSGLSATTGGTIDATGGIEAAGTLANAKIDLSSGSALLRTSSDIDSGISFLRGTSAVEFYGSSSPQIVNFSGQYRHVKVSKSANTFLVFSSALTLDGDLSITGGILSDNGVNIVSTGTGTTLNIDANAELEVGIQTSGNATFLPSFDTYSFDVASKVTYGAAGAQSIDPTPTYGNLAIEFMGGAGSHIKSAGGDLNIAGNLTVLQAVAGGITFSGGSDTHTVAGGIDGNGAIDLGTTGILSIGDNFNNTGTFNAVGTVIYNGATGQNVKATIYDTLSFTGTNTNGLFLGNVTATTLFVDSASFVTLSGNNLIVVGDATVDGTINGPGTVAFSNPGTMNIAGSGSIFAPVTSDSRNIVPGSVLTFGSSFTLNNASTVITNSGTTEIEVNLTGPAGAMWTQANNSALTIGGNITTLTFDADASGSSVTYDGGNQTVYVTPYSHLTVTSTFPAAKSIPSISIGGNFTVTGSSNATLTGSVTIQGDVSVTATLDTDSFPMSVFGNWTVTGTFSPDTGVVSFDGSTTQEISGGQFYDLAFSDPGQKNINTSIDAGNDFTINATAVVAPQGGVTINVGGDWSNSGTYTPGTTEVIFDGASPQTVGATGNQTFHKLTLSSANANFSGPAVFVSDDLQVPSGNATLGSTNLTVSGNLIVAGALNQGTATIDLDGDLTLDGSFTAGGPFTFTGATAQSIGGIAAGITFASVTFNNPAGISSSLDIGASNATFTAGVVTLDPGKTFAVFNGAVSVTSGYVVGRFSRTETFPGSTLFPIGSPTTGYAPMSLTATSAGTAAAEVIDTPHPNNTGGGSDILQIYWTIHSSTFTGTVDLGFNWTAGAVNGTEASYVLAYHDGVSWSTPGGTVTPNTGTISGVNSYLGDWTAGNPASVTDLSYFEVTTNGSTTAGTSEAITITAKNSSSTTITSYTGDHTFVFSGASSSPNGDAPVVVDKDLNEVVFGSNTVLTFTNGVATTTMKLFAEESITLIANEGSVGGGVNVNVSADAASELAFDDINGGNLLYANSPFYVIVTAVDTFGNPSGVTGSTDVTLDLSNCGGCTGTINAATGTIPMSATQALISPNTYSAAEAAVILTAVATSGDALASVDSAPQTFNAQSASLVVTSDADSGAGSLREALELNNAGGCVTPCNITFEIAPGGAKNISLGTALPQITNPVTLDAATQDGYSGTPLINVDGAITAGANGLELTDTANGSVIRGLSFTNFERALVIGGSNHTVESCWIGIDAAGTVGPSTIGIYLNDASLSTIGGTAAGAGNVVVSSLEAGIVFGGDTTSVTVAGNHIGTDAAGTTAYSNDIGIRFDDSAIGNTIGGATAGHRNVISGNATAGIYLQGSGGGVIASAPRRKGRTVGRHGVAIGTGIVENNVIQGNYIGTNAAGNAALGNGYGIQLAADTLNNTIGPDNVLSGNVKGVYISHFSAQDNLIVGNYIGVTDTLAPLGNTFAGISVGDGTDNHIGDINPGDGNVIAHNTNEGIVVGGGSGTVILGNSIYNNTAQGIDLNDDGPDTNTAGDADLGANGTQNYPGIVSAELAGANLNLVFNLDSTSAPTVPQAIRFEFFEVDDNTSEEGKTAIGISPCLLGASFSNYPLSMAVAGVAVGDEIVATATSFADAGCGAHEDGTSEFSPAVAVAACTPPAVTITGGTSFCTGGSVTLDAGVHTSYLWSTGETTQTISVNAANTYSVTVTNATGCQGSDSHVVTVNPLPTPAITGPTTACNSATLDAGGGYTNYLWSTGETTQQITVTSSNTYSVTVTDGNGCQGSDSHAITVNASTPVTIAGPATACDSA
ncbi:MAG TPA: hypothetical protein VEK57_06180, partial [Thermoanaerobaculia bacterium]|nr:hypothetical protein [Thermoanaerobaculia bacterium]